MRRIAVVLISCLYIYSCTSIPKTEEVIEVDKSALKDKPGQTQSSSEKQKVSEPKETVQKPVYRKRVMEDCGNKRKEREIFPLYLGEYSSLVTRISQLCSTQPDESVSKRISVITMGIPCTAPQGRARWQGMAVAPKIVNFSLSTNCAMKEINKENIQNIIKDRIQYEGEYRFIAHNPFAVQFWEIVGYPQDSDVGSTVNLRSAESRKTIWNDYRTGKPFQVKLYGRENAWTRSEDDHFFEVDAFIQPGQFPYFTLDVKSVKSLNKKERKAVAAKCQALKPRKNCSDIF